MTEILSNKCRIKITLAFFYISTKKPPSIRGIIYKGLSVKQLFFVTNMLEVYRHIT